MLITDCPTIEVKGIPHRTEARIWPSGEIVIWDGKRQYTTNCEPRDVGGETWKMALKHHWGTVWKGRKTC